MTAIGKGWPKIEFVRTYQDAFMEGLDFSFANGLNGNNEQNNIKLSLRELRDFLLKHANYTLTTGTYAVSTANFIAIPKRPHPADTAQPAFPSFGTFGNINPNDEFPAQTNFGPLDFLCWNYNGSGSPPAIDGNGVAVVPFAEGDTSFETLENFLGAATANTPYIWTFVDIDESLGTGDASIQAKGTGPDYNDPSHWAPNSNTMFADFPRGGGFGLNGQGAAASSTGDFITVDIFESGPFGNAAIQIEFNGNSDYQADIFNLASGRYYVATSPGQFSIQYMVDQSTSAGDVYSSNQYYLASCLIVPDEYAGQITHAAFCSPRLRNLGYDDAINQTGTAVLLNSQFNKSWTAGSNGIRYAVMLPLFQFGLNGQDNNSAPIPSTDGAGSAICFPVFVMLTAVDQDKELRIAGLLSDFIMMLDVDVIASLRPFPFDGRMYINWLHLNDILAPVNYSMWFPRTAVPLPTLIQGQ